jgi:hypothetical protein
MHVSATSGGISVIKSANASGCMSIYSRFVEDALRTGEDKCVVYGGANDSTDDWADLEGEIAIRYMRYPILRANVRWGCKASIGYGSSTL